MFSSNGAIDLSRGGLMAVSVYTIPAMKCPAEEALIRSALSAVPEVHSLEFDLVNRRLVVTHAMETDERLVAALREVGMDPQDPARRPSEAGRVWPEAEDRACNTVRLRTPATVASRAQLLRLGIAGVFALGAEVASWLTGEAWFTAAMSAVAILLGGMPTLRKGLRAVSTFTLNINFLMAIAVTGAFAIGEYPEAAVVIILFAVAELLEKQSLERARSAVRSLMELAPEAALVLQPDGSWMETDADDVPIGATVRVRPGERVPLDGIVVAGSSAVNQAPITGESIAVEKGPGDKVFAGTINESGVVEFRTTGGKDETTIARIVRTVQEAQAQRAPTQRFVDRFARVYTPVVCMVALFIALVPWLLMGEPFVAWFYTALVLLVIACPCALVISTPVTIVTGIAAAARQGILVKGGAFLERGRFLKLIAMDKTGTVTQGKPIMTDVVPIGVRTADEVHRIAASLDALSPHPIARAVSEAWQGELSQVSEFRAIPGRGVEGHIDNQLFIVGNERLMHDRGVRTSGVTEVLSRLEAAGKTAVMVAEAGGEVFGILSVADRPRQSSIKAIRALHDLGLRIMILSGDNQVTTEAIGLEVGVDRAVGGLLPEDKLAVIDELLREYGDGGVGMVGDGVNDAPALARASIGIAMGAAGTDVALETADVALMEDDLQRLPQFVKLSRGTSFVLTQNIAISIGVKALFFMLAVAGLATLWMAVVADVGATLLVVANAIRIRRLT